MTLDKEVLREIEEYAKKQEDDKAHRLIMTTGREYHRTYMFYYGNMKQYYNDRQTTRKTLKRNLIRELGRILWEED